MNHRFRHLFLLAFLLMSVPSSSVSAAALGAPAAASRAIFVDTDTGVDDALALALLLRAPGIKLVGISTVAGNTSVDNATQNVLTVLDAANRTVPVTVGASKPLEFPASRVGAFIHGPDGLWFAQQPHDLSGLPRDAAAAIAAAARANPGMTLLALGPLTNIAQAIQQYPADMAQVSIVALAGSASRGNRSPVAEANAFNDPQALDQVVQSSVPLTLVTLDAFEAATIDSQQAVKALASSRDSLFRLLSQPLDAYARAQTNGAGGPISIPDVVAVAYVLTPQLATPLGAIVEVETTGRTRGQTIIATDPNEKVFMIADDAELSALADAVFSGQVSDVNAAVGAILARHPDDALVVTALDPRTKRVLEPLLR